MSAQPNILFIITDQQSYDMMSCAGNQWLQTPALDTLAAGGTRFSRTYCSNPVCVPSRFSMFTGRMPSAIGMRANGGKNLTTFSDEQTQQTLGHLVAAAGYECVYGGKMHFPIGLTAENMGFEYFSNDECRELANLSADFIQRDHEKPWFMVSSLINPHDICYHAIRHFEESDMDHRLIANGQRECSYLDQALQLPAGVSEEDFFAQYCPPLPENHQVQEDEPSLINELLEERTFKKKAREQWTEKDWRMHRWAYHRLTERVDGEIAVILDALEASGQADNTLVIFTSDHGDHDGSHKLEHKTFFYEEAARIPMICRLPGKIAAGRIDDSHLINSGLDIMATICDYAGVDKPAHCVGSSMRPIAEELAEISTESDAFIGSYGENCISKMWVTAEYKYILYDSGTFVEQLYDLTNDPRETQNVAAENPEICTRYKKALEKQIAQHRELVL
ncbi:MAG: sulfatase-like hydrolase/transferase [Planctomycetes bacterium]|nr:sulfatase-like hydrolase/transferase [Planctomycetota bacterium]